MSENDRSYYQHRSATEIERARQAVDPSAAKIHQELAEAYQTKLASLPAPEKAST